MQKVTLLSLSPSLLLFLIRVFISFIAGLGDFAARWAGGRTASRPQDVCNGRDFHFQPVECLPPATWKEGDRARAGQVIVRMTETFGES